MKAPIFWSAQLGIVAVAAATAVYNVYALQYRFGGYDLSALIDAGWRVASGQVPNRDFICTFPPAVYLAAAAAFRVFGAQWHGLSVVSSIFFMFLLLLGLRVTYLLREELGHADGLFLSAMYSVFCLVPFLVVGHLWHSSLTESFVLYAVITTYALLRCGTWAARAELSVHLSVAVSLLLLAKPNTGFPAIAVCLVVLLMARLPVWLPVTAVVVAGVLDSLVLLRVHTSLAATLHVYSQLTSRFAPAEFFEGVFLNPNVVGGFTTLAVYAAVAPLLWVLARRAGGVRKSPVLGLAVGCALVMLLGFGTNVEFKLVDAPCLLLGFTLWAMDAELPDGIGGFVRWRTGLVYAAGTFFVFAVFLSASRARMQNVGEWGTDACGIPEEIDKADGFFGDFYGCRPFFSVLAESDAALAAHPGRNVFFGPRMEFLYARDRVNSPRGLPMWWHPGSSYPEGREGDVVRTWEANHFERLVFLHNDRTRLPAAILALIEEEYVPVEVPPVARYAAEREQPDAHVDIYVRRVQPDPGSRK